MRPLTAGARAMADEADRAALADALVEASGDVSAAALALGIPRRTLSRRIAQHQLGPVIEAARARRRAARAEAARLEYLARSAGTEPRRNPPPAGDAP